MKKIILNIPEDAPNIIIRTGDIKDIRDNVFDEARGFYIVPSEVSEESIIDMDSQGNIRAHKLTPNEFWTRMEELSQRFRDDEELAHLYMDKLLCRILREQGFEDGVDVFEDQRKGYA